MRKYFESGISNIFMFELCMLLFFLLDDYMIPFGRVLGVIQIRSRVYSCFWSLSFIYYLLPFHSGSSSILVFGVIFESPWLTSTVFRMQFIKNCLLGFPGGAVVESLPANAGDTGSSPGLGRSHMPWSN